MSSVFENSHAEYYDLLYRDKDYAEESAYVAECLKHHGVEAGAILELGSGTGKHALQLARTGFCVLGIERSDAMVRIANERIPPDCAERLKFETGDVRFFRSCSSFDAVISLFHVVSYQTTNEDVISTFRTAAQNLRQGGLFMFDFWYGPAVLTERPSVRVKQIKDEEVSVVRIGEPTLDVRKNLAVIDFRIIVRSIKNGWRDRRERHYLRYLFEPELNDMLEQTGFEVCDAHEWFSRKPLGTDTWSATFVARKR